MPASTSLRPAHLSSASDNWPTPQDFYDTLDAEFGFVLDVCASTANHKTTRFYALDHSNPDRRDAPPRTGPRRPQLWADRCG